MPTDDAQPDALQPWHRQPCESSRAYRAFRAYLDLGEARSLEAAAAKLTGLGTERAPTGHHSGTGVAPEWPPGGSEEAPKKPTPQAPGRIKEWSRRWSWVARAAAFDAHMALIRQRAAEEQERRKARQWVDRRAQQFERQHRLGVALQDQADVLLSFPPAAQTVVDDGGTKIIHVQPVEILDRYRAGRMAAVGAELAERAIDRAIEASTPSARPVAELATRHHYAAAEARLTAFRQRMQLKLTVPAEPPDDDHEPGVFNASSAAS